MKHSTGWILFVLRSLTAIGLSACALGQSTNSVPPSVITASPVILSNTPAPDLTAIQRSIQTLTAAPAQTSIAKVQTQIALTPSRTVTATPIPSITSTQPPTPEWLTPIATALARKPQSPKERLTLQVLRMIGYGFEYYSDAGNLFDIDIVGAELDPAWLEGERKANLEQSLAVFFSYAPEPTVNPVATMTTDEWVNWQKAKKMMVEDLATGDHYWVKWEDYLLHRPIEFVGWIEDQVFVFRQCGNPRLCFVTAIDAKQRQFLLTLELHDYS